MEVHHHSHTSRKKWAHYFWEFLMLFLAVFCGFMAENQREHLIEHRREKVYMSSMLTDIRADTNMLNRMHQTFAQVTVHIDSLIPLLQKHQELETNAVSIYKHQVWLNFFARWIYSDRTMSQLKNSGNFRLVRKRSVSDMIIDYDGYATNYVGDMQQQYILPLWRAMNEASAEIFRSGVGRKKFKLTGWNESAIELSQTPFFITTEKYLLEKFINRLEQYAMAIEWGNININNALEKAIKLDSAIKKEYHLK